MVNRRLWTLPDTKRDDVFTEHVHNSWLISQSNNSTLALNTKELVLHVVSLLTYTKVLFSWCAEMHHVHAMYKVFFHMYSCTHLKVKLLATLNGVRLILARHCTSYKIYNAVSFQANITNSKFWIGDQFQILYQKGFCNLDILNSLLVC